MKNERKIEIEAEKCIGCGQCLKICPTGIWKIEQGKAVVAYDDCISCGHCVAICPKEAISLLGAEDDVCPMKDDVRLDPDRVLDVIRFRRSIRRFEEKPIPDEALRKILEAGRLTHTAKNMQDVSFVVLDREKDRIERLGVRLLRRLKPFANLFSRLARRTKIDDHFFFFRAPIAIVVVAEEEADGVLAAQNMEFVAEACGLGVLFSGFFTVAANSSRKIRKELRIPAGKQAAATLVLGYPKVKFLRSAPRKAADVVFM